MSEKTETESPSEATEAKPSRWKRWGKEALLLLLIVVAVRWWQRRDLPSGPAPELQATTISGDLATLAADGPVLVHFWATWCGVCKAMDHNVVAVAEDRRVLTIASQSGPSENVAAWMRDNDLYEGDEPTFATVADPRSELARRWGVSAFPTSFVVDEEGEIRHVEVGYTSELGLRARLWLAD